MSICQHVIKSSCQHVIMLTIDNFLVLLTIFGNFCWLLENFIKFWPLSSSFGNCWQLLASFGNFWPLWCYHVIPRHPTCQFVWQASQLLSCPACASWSLFSCEEISKKGGVISNPKDCVAKYSETWAKGGKDCLEFFPLKFIHIAGPISQPHHWATTITGADDDLVDTVSPNPQGTFHKTGCSFIFIGPR